MHVTDELLDDTSRGVAEVLVSWRGRLAKHETNFALEPMARAIFEGRMVAMIEGYLGALDTHAIELEKRQGTRRFSQAVAEFKERAPVTKKQWAKLEETERRYAFTVARVVKRTEVARAKSILERAIDEGWSPDDFADETADLFDPAHARTIMRTNAATAYIDGRKRFMKSPAVADAFPYWEWRCIRDKRTRPTHLAMHGLAMLHSDEAWETIGPPAGFNCRCTIVPVATAAQEITGEDARALALPDDGWEPSGKLMLASDRFLERYWRRAA